MSESQRTSIPKFGSFKPKVKPKESAVPVLNLPARHHDSTEPKLDRRQSDNPERGWQESPHDVRRRHRVSDVDRYNESRSSVRNGTINSFPSGDVNPIQVSIDTNESTVFIVDRRGDQKNVQYGSLHKYSIPDYVRTGCGFVFGASHNAKIDRDASDEKHVVFRPNITEKSRRADRLLTRKKRRLMSEPTRLVISAPPLESFSKEEDFVSFGLGATPHHRIRLLQDPASVYHHAGGIETELRDSRAGDGVHNMPALSDNESEKSVDIDHVESQIRQQNSAILRNVKENPQDLQSWMTLIEHQTEVAFPGNDYVDLTSSEKQSLAEIRISIYEDALKHILPGADGHEELTGKMLREGAQIWDAVTLTSKWEMALKAEPRNVKLCVRYLDFLQSNHFRFRTDTCRDSFVRCLGLLKTEISNGSGLQGFDLAYTQIYVFLRLTIFLRDAGYDELSYSLWQILLEKQFFRPPELCEDMVMEALESFWDCECPRIGEAGAAGWANFHNGEVPPSSRGCLLQPIPAATHEADPWRALVDQEAHALGLLSVPDSTDEEQSHDPFRHVLFSDMRETLDCLSGDIPTIASLNGFLSFMHLPSLPCFDDDQRLGKWRSDAFLHTEMPLGEGATTVFCTEHSETSTYSLFNGEFRSFANVVSREPPGESHLIQFVDSVLGKLVWAVSESDAVAEYWLAFRKAFIPQKMSKTAKSLLKSRPSSLRLYSAYAMMEASLGQLGKAKDIWSIALSLSQSQTSDSETDIALYWHSWLITYALRDESDEALQCLSFFAHSEQIASRLKPTSVFATSTRLKAEQRLVERIESLMYRQKFSIAVLYMDCVAWLTYLVDGHALGDSLAILDKYDSEMPPQSRAQELLHQAKARFIELHISSKRPYTPAPLREHLARSITLFAENDMFLRAFHRVGARTRVDDHLRSVLHSPLPPRSHAGLISWSHLVDVELRRYRSSAPGSTAQSVRNVFSTALTSAESNVTHSIALWMQYFRFEAEAAATTPKLDRFSKVKEVFLQGLRYLPWCKAWVVLGMKFFAEENAISRHELEQLYEVMVDRELRIRASAEGTKALHS